MSFDPAVLDLLTAVPVDAAMIGQFAGLSCGDTPAGRTATEWITDAGLTEVRYELRRGTRVWAYRNVVGQWVGFGSLRQDWWKLGRPPVRQAVHYLPMIGVFAEHQGRPTADAGVPKYCYQLLAHLLDQASVVVTPFVGLSVHPDNAKAIHIYERTGFTFVDQGRLSRMVLRQD